MTEEHLELRQRIKRAIKRSCINWGPRACYIAMSFLTGYYAMGKIICNKAEENGAESFRGNTYNYFRHHELDLSKTMAYTAYYFACLISGALNGYSSHIFSKKLDTSISNMLDFGRSNPSLFTTSMSISTLTAVTPVAAICNGGILIPNHDEVNDFLNHPFILVTLAIGSFMAIWPIFAEDFKKLMESRTETRATNTAMSSRCRRAGFFIGDCVMKSIWLLGPAQSINYTGIPIKILSETGIIKDYRHLIIAQTILVVSRIPFIIETYKRSNEAWKSYKQNAEDNILKEHLGALVLATLNSIVLAMIFYANSLQNNIYVTTGLVVATIIFGTLARAKNILEIAPARDNLVGIEVQNGTNINIRGDQRSLKNYRILPEESTGAAEEGRKSSGDQSVDDLLNSTTNLVPLDSKAQSPNLKASDHRISIYVDGSNKALLKHDGSPADTDSEASITPGVTPETKNLANFVSDRGPPPLPTLDLPTSPTSSGRASHAGPNQNFPSHVPGNLSSDLFDIPSATLSWTQPTTRPNSSRGK